MSRGQMRILYLLPGVGLSSKEKERRRKILQSHASQGTVVGIKEIEEGPTSIESYYDEYMAGPSFLKQVEMAEASNYDAVIIGCASDACKLPAREVASIPIVGPQESGVFIASMLCQRFSIITSLNSAIPRHKERIRSLGVESKLASVRALDIPVLELGRDIKRIKDALLKEAQAAKEDGAEAVIIGCMSIAFSGICEEVMEKVGLMLINPVPISVKIAELMIELGLRHSKISNPYPPKLSR